ncbi:hypothetical protein [Bradyrhizobium sp. Arg816]|nr:hypothetical protein [Bradyrhizobium sp. Arg816]MDI3560031.1 hypothetical protein [Bradyrhizobium sp. Arg816]
MAYPAEDLTNLWEKDATSTQKLRLIKFPKISDQDARRSVVLYE